VARYLSPEWVQNFDAALGALDLSEAIAAAASGSLAAADGAFSVAQVVSGVPSDVSAGPEVRVVLTVAEGRAHLAFDPEGGSGTATPWPWRSAAWIRPTPWRPGGCASAATWRRSSPASKSWRRRRDSWVRRSMI
jgi:hypothetical protein